LNPLARRVQRLQRQFPPAPDYRLNPRERLRVIVAAMDHDLSLTTSTCSRTLCGDGTLLEVVDLDGTRADLSEEELDRFVATFPIQMLAPR
jgi:hypothetical protein